MIIDGLQYALWSDKVFRQMREGGVTAVHATVAYHEGFRETVDGIAAWRRRFRAHGDLIRPARTGADIRAAAAERRTAILLGAQSPLPIEGDLALLEILHDLGLTFMQLAYNTQSPLATGWTEAEDPGLTLMGREAVAEMNRLGMVIDMSHAATRSTLEAIEASGRPVTVSHANPRRFRETGRNVADEVLRALGETGGMLGLSLYPHHLPDGPDCTLERFCQMAARTAEIIGPGNLGLGSDLCQDRPDETLLWMRHGRWSAAGWEAPADPPRFPAMPAFFRDNRDFPTISRGLREIGFSASETEGIMGCNWLRFLSNCP